MPRTVATLILFLLSILCATTRADDIWQVAIEGLGFSDGLTTDREGNLYFSDLRAKPPTIHKLAPDGTRTKITDASRSGLEIGADGLLYACGSGKVTSLDLAAGKETTLAEGLQTNDLAVSANGHIYITETGKKQVTLVNAKTREVKPVDVGIAKPNGIALSHDQSTLFVSDYGGLHVYAFRVNPSDGTLSDKVPLMTMRAPDKTPDVAGGDGMTVDPHGRAYVTSAIGLQIFDKDGKLLEVLPKPQNAPLVSAAFAGKNHDTLYIACGDKIYRRK